MKRETWKYTDLHWSIYLRYNIYFFKNVNKTKKHHEYSLHLFLEMIEGKD